MANLEEMLAGIDVDTTVSAYDTPAESKTDTLLQKKQDKTDNLYTSKYGRTDTALLGTTGGQGFYDMDSPYSRGTGIDTEKGTLRLGDPDSSKALYANAPESPSTIEWKYKRPATPEETAAYNASMIVKDNFAMGTTAATPEQVQDLVDYPLTPENQRLYDDAMKKVYAEGQGQGIELRGNEGHVGEQYGRQVVQAYQPDGPNPEESLEERMLNTGIGDKYSYGKPVAQDAEQVTSIQPKYSDEVYEKLGELADDDGMLGESLDIAQSSLVQMYGKTSKALRKVSRGIAESLGLDKETVDAWLPESDKVNALGFDKTATELARPEVADKITGVMATTREEQQAGMEAGMAAIEDGNYGTAAVETLKILPYMLGDSAGEMAAIMAGYPGIAIAVGARVSEDAEAYEENNKAKPDMEWFAESTAANLAVMLGERFLVKTGLGKVLEKGTSKTGRAGGIVGSGLGEGTQEYADQLQQTYLTQTEGERTLGEIATSPEQEYAALAGGTMGAGLRGTGEATKTAYEGVKEGVKRAGEYADAKLGTLESGEAKDMPSTVYGRRNMWESMDNPEFAVAEDDKSKEVYAKSVSAYVADVMLSEKERKETGRSAVGIIDEAADKVMKVYGIDPKDDAAREVVRGEVVRKAYEQMKGVTKKGEQNATDEEIQKYVEDVYAKYGDSPVVDKEIESVYQNEIRKKFRDMQEGMSRDEVEAMKDTPLTEENYKKIKKVIDSMRSLGSEDLGTFADKLERGLEVHQEKMGSEDGEADTERVKTIEDVSDEVMFLGFMELQKRSIAEHGTRMGLDLGNPVGDPKDAETTLELYDKFVQSRMPEKKLTSFWKDKGKVKVRSVGSIRKLIQEMLVENGELAKVAESTLEKTTLTDGERAGVEASLASIRESIAELEALDEMGRTRKDAELLETVAGYSATRVPPEVKQEIERLKVRADKKAETAESTEAKQEPKEEELTLAERKKMAVQVAKKIYEGEKEFTAEEMQFQKNYGADIEKILAQKAKMDKKKADEEAVKEQESAVDEEPVKEEPTKEEPETTETVKKKVKDVYARVNSLRKQIRGYENLEAARKDVGRAEKMRQVAQEEVDKLASEEKALQKRLDKVNGELKGLKAHIGKAYTRLKEKGDVTDKRKFGRELQKVAGMLDKVLGKMARSLSDVIGVLEGQYAEKIDMKADLVKEMKAVKADKRKKVAELKEAKAKEQRLKKASPKRKLVKELEAKAYELVSATRKMLVDTAPGILEANKKTTGSVSEIVANADENVVDVLLENAARVVRESEDGKERVEQAVATLDEYVEMRKGAGIPLQDEKDLMNKLAEDKYQGQSVADMINSTDPEVKELVERAFAVTALTMYNAVQDVRTMRDDQVDDYVNGAFAGLPGNTNGEVDPVYAKQLKSMLRAGDMVPVATYAGKAGKMVLREMGVKLKGLTAQEVADIERSLGTVVMTNMMGTASNRGIEWKMARVVKGKVELTAPYAGESDGGVVRVLDMRKLDEGTAKEYRNAGNVFEYVNMKDEHGVSLEPTKYKKGKKVRNGNTEVSEKALAYLNKQNGYAWKFTADMDEVMKEVDGDAGKLAELILGTEEDVIARTQVMDMESALAKHTADKLDIERMVDTYRLVGDKEFYVNWDYTTSDRNMIDNSQFNPQNSKVSRFLSAMDDMKNVIELKNEEDVHMTKAAIAQALDMDIDKKSDEAAFEELGKLVNVDKDGVTFADKKFEDVVARGTLTAIREWEPDMSASEVMHVYQAVRALRGLMVDGKAESSLALEADGITNGMMATLMQMGYTKDSIEHMVRGGLYLDGVEYENHGQYKEDGGTDVYEAPVQNVQESMTEREVELITSIVGGKWRNFMKGPVMVFIYGAGMKNIRKSISRSLVVGNGYIKGGMAAGKLDELVELAGDALKMEVVPKYVVYNKKTGEYDSRLKRDLKNPEQHVYITDAEVEALADAIETKIGEKFENGFKSTFGGVIKFRKALKAVEQLNYVVFKSEMNKKLMKMGVDKLTDLKPEQIEKVYEELMKEGTYYSQTNSLGGEQDYMKLQDAEGTGMMSVTIPRHMFQGSNTRATMKEYVKELASNVGAIGVTSIHSIDGSVMVTGHKQSVLNIYDALMLGTDAGVNGKSVTEMNEAFYKRNMEHSVLGKAVQKLLKNADKVDWSLFTEDQVFMGNMVSDMRRVFEKGETVMDAADLSGYIDEIHAGRLEMKDRGLTVNQYYVTDAIPGYEGKGGDVEAVYTDGKETEEKGVMEALFSRMQEEYVKGVANQEDIKRKNGIISEVEDIVANTLDGKAGIYVNKVLADMIEKRYVEEC